MRGTQIIRNAVVLRPFVESPFDITSVTASKKTRTAIAMAQQAITTLDVVVDDRLIIVALHEVNVSAIILVCPSFSINTLPEPLILTLQSSITIRR